MPKHLLTKLRDQERTLSKSLTSLKAALADLEAAGLTDGKPTWNSGKYLYMYHPDPGKKGGRDRRYIGSDPAKVRSALEAVQRTEVHQRLKKQHDAAEALLKRIVDTLERLHSDVCLGIDQYQLECEVDLTRESDRRSPTRPFKRSKQQ